MKTREKILKESIKLFAEHGFERTSMSKIASLLGFTKPALYAHYKNKAALFEACLDTISHEQNTFIKSILENPSYNTVEAKLYFIIKDCTLIQENHAFLFYNRFYLLPPVELKEQIKYRLDESTEKWTSMLMDVINNAIESGEIDKSLTKTEVLSSYICILNGIGFEVETKQNLDHIWKIFWRGIKAN
ncbi:TetR/AcrR family transcriptional regulator [Paenibacillus kribbensis]|uniref:TetR/AcrR family transcriptional regulator n=1 Tax=Paenibacillus TaxID=44249 RepID=UPI0005C464EB|nr:MULTISPECIES: TetR/AcrR family transcriptional regulator [Paenibacillus]MEC0234165.1 TetR/AcrR family transcriptional regulator [Paenibacillus kribbensis]